MKTINLPGEQFENVKIEAKKVEKLELDGGWKDMKNLWKNQSITVLDAIVVEIPFRHFQASRHNILHCPNNAFLQIQIIL